MHCRLFNFRILPLLATLAALSGCWWDGHDHHATTQSFALGGSVSGLSSDGLVLANGSNTVTVAAGATSFSFAATVANGSSYAVSVKTQPAGANCTVANGAGTMGGAAVSSVQVTCVAVTHRLGGTLTGLVAAGLVLANGSDTVAPAAGATTFTFTQPVAEGTSFAVSVQTQPAGATCAVTGGSGTMGTADVASVQVACTPNGYHVGGTIQGLTAAGLILANGTDTVSPAANATTFTFAGTVASGATFSVAVQQQPTGLNCSVGGSFPATMLAADVTNVPVTCSAASGLAAVAGKESCPTDATYYADGTGAAASVPVVDGMAIDGAGNIYAASMSTFTIRKITPSGVVTTLAGKYATGGYTDGNGANARFTGPQGIAIDPTGTLFVADSILVRKVTAAADVTTIAGSSTSAGFVDGTGSAASFNGLRDIVRSSSGDYYLSDTNNSVIRKVTAAGVVTTFAGGGAPGVNAPGFLDGVGTAALFYAPRGLAIDAADNIYVADEINQSIRKITPSGVVTTLAGGGPANPGLVDGTGSAARFADPKWLAMGPGGAVYVTDQIGDQTTGSVGGGISGAIRMVSASGVVTTIAAEASLHSPTGIQLVGGLGAIATDAAGTLYANYGCAVVKVGP